MYQYSFNFFVYNRCFLPQVYLFAGFFVLRGFFHRKYFYRTFPDFVKFEDISRTWKMNLLFSRFSRTRVNLVMVAAVVNYRVLGTGFSHRYSNITSSWADFSIKISWFRMFKGKRKLWNCCSKDYFFGIYKDWRQHRCYLVNTAFFWYFVGQVMPNDISSQVFYGQVNWWTYEIGRVDRIQISGIIHNIVFHLIWHKTNDKQQFTKWIIDCFD